MLASYHQRPSEDRLNVREADDITTDTMHLCWLLDAVYKTKDKTD